MKSNLRVLSLTAFSTSIPALIITDWYYKGFGILIMFALLTIGLILDQVIRLKFPTYSPSPNNNYKKNKLLNIISLTLFMQSPMVLIFGNRLVPNLGFWLMIIILCIGVTLDQIARRKYPYILK